MKTKLYKKILEAAKKPLFSHTWKVHEGTVTLVAYIFIYGGKKDQFVKALVQLSVVNNDMPSVQTVYDVPRNSEYLEYWSDVPVSSRDLHVTIRATKEQAIKSVTDWAKHAFDKWTAYYTARPTDLNKLVYSVR